MKLSASKTALALAAMTMTTQATPLVEKKGTEVEVEPRQLLVDIVLGAIIGASSGAAGALLGPDNSQCSNDESSSGEGWWTRIYDGSSGTNVTIAEVCWNAGGYSISDVDAGNVDCVMELHRVQATTCIDVEGSSCQADDGTAVGNVKTRETYNSGNSQQPPDEVVDKVKSAFRAMVGHEKGWDISSYMEIQIMEDDSTYSSWGGLVFGTGASNC
ncbi:hypothetical protein GGR57DRAFT_520973 [Xylariaceae sp. FL1272]|nr:hypothetical protein GGR57DRAFT_520973 [Xylariaceae sp. FL1272]